MSPVHSTPSCTGASLGATPLRLVVEPLEAGLRLDELVCARLAIGRGAAARLIASTAHNGRPARKGDRVAAGDEVVVHAAPPLAAAPPGDGDAAPTIVRLEDHFAILNKPAGLPSVALIGRSGASAAGFAAARFPECASLGAPGECGLVHRLDTETSGVLVLARSEPAYRALRRQFEDHRVEKSYLALVEGAVTAPFSVDVPIGQHRKSRRRMRGVEGAVAIARYRARPASTAVEPVERLGGATIVRAVTSTGARHQIRVHLAHAGHPLVADSHYGGAPSAGIARFLLHAERISFRHPTTGAPVAECLAEPESWRAARRALQAD